MGLHHANMTVSNAESTRCVWKLQLNVFTVFVQALDTGSVMSFILATTQALGDLRHVRVWHDDSGPDDKGSWYLGRLVAEDLQNGDR